MLGSDDSPVNATYLMSSCEQQAMARYHDEDDQDANRRVKTSHTLSRQFWKGQLHGSGLGRTPIHATHMRPRCSVIPGGTWTFYKQLVDPVNHSRKSCADSMQKHNRFSGYRNDNQRVRSHTGARRRRQKSRQKIWPYL